MTAIEVNKKAVVGMLAQPHTVCLFTMSMIPKS